VGVEGKRKPTIGVGWVIRGPLIVYGSEHALFFGHEEENSKLLGRLSTRQKRDLIRNVVLQKNLASNAKLDVISSKKKG